MGTSQSYRYRDFYYNPEGFIGREAEVAYLVTRVIHEKKRVGLITGNNAVGKTCLVRFFLGQHLRHLENQTEFLSFHEHYEKLPELNSQSQLIIIDDISYDFNSEKNDKLLRFIDRYPDKQFILVSPFEDKLVNRHISYMLCVANFSENESLIMLTKILEKKKRSSTCC